MLSLCLLSNVVSIILFVLQDRHLDFWWCNISLSCILNYFFTAKWTKFILNCWMLSLCILLNVVSIILFILSDRHLDTWCITFQWMAHWTTYFITKWAMLSLCILLNVMSIILFVLPDQYLDFWRSNILLNGMLNDFFTAKWTKFLHCLVL